MADGELQAIRLALQAEDSDTVKSRYKKPLDIRNSAPVPPEFVWENKKLSLLAGFLSLCLVTHTVSYIEVVVGVAGAAYVLAFCELLLSTLIY